MRSLLLLVGAIVFVDTMFFAVVAPLLPDYEEELGLSKTAAGILLAAYPAGTLLGALPSGMLAARIGPRRAVLTGLALLVASSITYAVASSIVVLDAARFVQGVGGACSWAGGMAWLLADAPANERGRLIGAAMGAAIAGGLFGPAVGGLAAAVGEEPVFGAIAALALGLAVWAGRTPGGRPGETAGAPVRGALRDRRVLVGMWLVLLPALGFGVIDTLVPLRMDDLGATTFAVAAAFFVAAATEGTLSPFVGRLSDRRGRLVPIRAGLGLAVVLVLLGPLPDVAFLVGALLVATAGALGTCWAPSMALLADASDAVGLDQGVGFGLMNLAWAGGMVVGAAAGGALADAMSDTIPYMLLAVLLAGTLAAVHTLVRTPVTRVETA